MIGSKNALRATATLLLLLIAVMAGPEIAWACDSCWGARVDTPTTRGISFAMTALIGMTTVVWGGIGAFFLHVRRRSRLLEPGDMVVNEYGEIRQSENRGPDENVA